MQETRRATATVGLPLDIATAASFTDLDYAMTALGAAGCGGLLVDEDLFHRAGPSALVELAARHRLPAIYPLREFADEGGLLSYGANYVDAHRRGAAYVDKILKGANPAVLPVEQPTTFDLVVNLRTAQILGLPVSRSLLQQATAVVQ